jgi:hypothetical protein
MKGPHHGSVKVGIRFGETMEVEVKEATRLWLKGKYCRPEPVLEWLSLGDRNEIGSDSHG